jgi:type I restriction enzyme R subunit
MSTKDTPAQIRLDERQHVEKPLQDQLAGLGWEIIDLDAKQHPGDSHRANFTEVVMLSVLREQLKVINPWLEDDQVDEVVKQLTANFPSTNLLQNNRHVFNQLLENTSVSENRKMGEKSPSVKFIDFKNRDNNRFVAVCQFKIRILGTEHHIIPDIVLFLNGLPVVVIECKSPKVKEPIPEAIDQLLRYSEQRGAKGEGSAPLFFYNQFVVTTCRQGAKFGTITTHTEKLFYRWADPYPRTLNDLDHGSSSPNDQQRLVAGMLDRDNLLELIRTFTIFSTNDKGELIKVVARYQQFRAVKLAVKRLLAGKNPRERSGIIWHTQGSGKSLTMMFMVREMYRHPALSKWKVVFVKWDGRGRPSLPLRESNLLGHSTQTRWFAEFCSSSCGPSFLGTLAEPAHHCLLRYPTISLGVAFHRRTQPQIHAVIQASSVRHRNRLCSIRLEVRRCLRNGTAKSMTVRAARSMHGLSLLGIQGCRPAVFL